MVNRLQADCKQRLRKRRPGATTAIWSGVSAIGDPLARDTPMSPSIEAILT